MIRSLIRSRAASSVETVSVAIEICRKLTSAFIIRSWLTTAARALRYPSEQMTVGHSRAAHFASCSILWSVASSGSCPAFQSTQGATTAIMRVDVRSSSSWQSSRWFGIAYNQQHERRENKPSFERRGLTWATVKIWEAAVTARRRYGTWDTADKLPNAMDPPSRRRSRIKLSDVSRLGRIMSMDAVDAGS